MAIDFVVGPSDVVLIGNGPVSDVDPFFDLLVNHAYVLFFADVPLGMTRGPSKQKLIERQNEHWNMIARAVEICTGIDIPALIGGMRGRYWFHPVPRQLLESGQMLESSHRWCSFGLVPFHREDDSSMTDARYTLFHNRILDLSHTHCTCPASTHHTRFELKFRDGQMRDRFKVNEQAMLQMLLSSCLRTYLCTLLPTTTEPSTGGAGILATGPPESKGTVKGKQQRH